MFLPSEDVVKPTAHQPVVLQVMLKINLPLLYVHCSLNIPLADSTLLPLRTEKMEKVDCITIWAIVHVDSSNKLLI